MSVACLRQLCLKQRLRNVPKNSKRGLFSMATSCLKGIERFPGSGGVHSRMDMTSTVKVGRPFRRYWLFANRSHSRVSSRVVESLCTASPMEGGGCASSRRDEASSRLPEVEVQHLASKGRLRGRIAHQLPIPARRPPCLCMSAGRRLQQHPQPLSGHLGGSRAAARVPD